MSLIKPMIAVFDKKTGLFDPPFVVRRVGEAIREWETITKDTNTKFGKHPSDYDLYQVGNFDEETGLVTSQSPHLHLASGVQ